MKYKIEVTQTYKIWEEQTIYVEADSEDEARQIALKRVDIADVGEWKEFDSERLEYDATSIAPAS